MITRTHNKLFTPVQVGAITLKHCIVMPPLSRLRAEWPSGVPSDLMLEYYSQRASDGGLIFTEATAVAASGRGYRGAPGIYSDEQVAGWKRITGAVHAKGGYMFAQLWHAGRTTHVAVRVSGTTKSVDALIVKLHHGKSAARSATSARDGWHPCDVNLGDIR